MACATLTEIEAQSEWPMSTVVGHFDQGSARPLASRLASRFRPCSEASLLEQVMFARGELSLRQSPEITGTSASPIALLERGTPRAPRSFRCEALKSQYAREFEANDIKVDLVTTRR